MGVFLLWHVHELPGGEEGAKLIGACASAVGWVKRRFAAPTHRLSSPVGRRPHSRAWPTRPLQPEGLAHRSPGQRPGSGSQAHTRPERASRTPRAAPWA